MKQILHTINMSFFQKKKQIRGKIFNHLSGWRTTEEGILRVYVDFFATLWESLKTRSFNSCEKRWRTKKAKQNNRVKWNARVKVVLKQQWKLSVGIFSISSVFFHMQQWGIADSPWKDKGLRCHTALERYFSPSTLHWNHLDYLCRVELSRSKHQHLCLAQAAPQKPPVLQSRALVQGRLLQRGTAATGGSPMAGSPGADYHQQGKDQLVRGLFLCTAKELSAAEVSWIPGRIANPVGNEGSSSPPLLGITPSFSINP